MSRRPASRPLVIGPLPPPVGGIATMVAKLFADPAARAGIALLDTRKPPRGGRVSGLLFSLRLLVRLAGSLARAPSRALAFSSAGHSFWEKAVWLALARLRGVPMALMMVDGNFPEFYDRLPRPLQWLGRRMLEACEVVITQTESWRRYYQSIAPGARLLVLSNGVDMSEFPAREREPRASPVVLLVGWLIPAKGVFDLIDAARILHLEGLAFSVQLLGPEHGYGPQLQQRLHETGLTGVVQLRPEVWSRQELLQAYHDADIFALPSWAEGLPNALMEAMASGLPAVATEVGGIPDVVQNGVSGQLVPARNPERLAGALRPLLQDPDLRRRMGQNATARISTTFTNEPFIAGLRALLAKPCAA
jgi:glycosyltransferase involved in cell wall biosynthesis